MVAHDQQTRLEAVRLYKEEGHSMLAISRHFGISYTSVRSWIKRYEAEGEKGLVARYACCGRPATYSEAIMERACSYKKDHPDWGAPFILLKLADDFPDQALPKARRLQQVFRQRDLYPKRSRQPRGKAEWAKQPFDRVQVDAKEGLQTADGQDCCYLNFTDEHTGSELDAFVFPLR